jgi:hypothetical protein
MSSAHPAPTKPPSYGGSATRPPDPGGLIRIADGCVITMDPELGDFARGDVFIDGDTIVAVGQDLEGEGERSRDTLATGVGFELDVYADYPSVDFGTHTLRV